MTLPSIVVALCALAGLTMQLPEGSGKSAASDKERAADRAAIDKLHQQDLAATLSRDSLR